MYGLHASTPSTRASIVSNKNGGGTIDVRLFCCVNSGFTVVVVVVFLPKNRFTLDFFSGVVVVDAVVVVVDPVTVTKEGAD